MSDRHKHIVKAFKACKIDQEKYYMPMEIPGRKLKAVDIHHKKNAEVTQFLRVLRKSKTRKNSLNC